jgi:cytochrome c-type biogenesis protein CcmF
VLMAGPLLRWRQDEAGRLSSPMTLATITMIASLLAFVLLGGSGALPLIGFVLAGGLAVASLLPLRGRNLRRTPLAVWGMVVAHFGVAVALAGMACESAFSVEKLVAAKAGDTVEVGPWRVVFRGVEPVAGPNWTALQADISATYGDDRPVSVRPQARSFWSPPQQTSEAALITRNFGQLYAVLGEEAEGGRWQLRLWWKPFVTLIWLGGGLIALGGLLALLGRVAFDMRRAFARRRIVMRREDIAVVVSER